MMMCRVKHVTVLLAESERECARMAQLSELLKGELRRVRGASAHAHNTEYMKNVTFKFLTLPPGDERSRLIPVLQKILTLTPDETQKIQAIAKGPQMEVCGICLPLWLMGVSYVIVVTYKTTKGDKVDQFSGVRNIITRL
ncbi:GRIP and coiled-coil domain-containing protein 2 [Papilio machaon]|uniref:GRIP and coiled-coil domain-containing protein 2 n=1 Tax=Papilio machaon TaxID=76193 RepID=A0A194R8V7_PAPMA|nr:GRIP and coiled-coil domain-containing protein 2 [Papilio machaon]